MTGTISEDWEAVKQRYLHWWGNDLHDRALVQVTAPRAGAGAAEGWPGGEVTPEVRWTNVDYKIWSTLEDLRTTWYGGEALPVCSPLGWSVGGAALMGCEPLFRDDTVWVEPLPSGDAYPELRFAREGPWWPWARESLRTAVAASQGRFFVCPGIGNESGDVVAVLRGSQTLMMDIALDPEWVRGAVQRASDILREAYAGLWPLVDPAAVGLEGSVEVGLWTPGPALELNCDVACMVSPADFERIFLPPLVEAARTVDNIVFELDGPGVIKHLDALLSVPEFQAFYWTPGAGRRGIRQWVPLIRRILAAGKGLQVSPEPDEVEALLEDVPARGLLMRTSCSTEAEGWDLIELVARRSR